MNIFFPIVVAGNCTFLVINTKNMKAGLIPCHQAQSFEKIFGYIKD